MGNGHEHGNGTIRHERPLWWALGLTGGFLIAEVVGAFLTGSLALLSDAAHMGTDTLALSIALVAVRLARRPPDAKRSYGYARMEAMGANMPFDGMRMIFAGFDSMIDDRADGSMGYVDGYLVPVPDGNKDAYRAMAAKASEVFRDHGATRVVEAWGDDVPDGKVTDYHRAAHRKDGETVVFSWVEWPDKETRMAGWDKVMKDERMQHDPNDQTFDGKRIIYGGFAPIVEA